MLAFAGYALIFIGALGILFGLISDAGYFSIAGGVVLFIFGVALHGFDEALKRIARLEEAQYKLLKHIAGEYPSNGASAAPKKSMMRAKAPLE